METLKPKIGITEGNSVEIATILNTLLADEYLLCTKTRNAQWNIHGQSFNELHKLFEIQYKELDGIIDDIAVRVRILGHYALGAMKDYLNITRLNEPTHDFSNQKQIVQTLLDDHEEIIRILRKEIIATSVQNKDFGTTDFVICILEIHEKMAWVLRSYLQ
ncbi:MAG: DNA starvation/stationary phase protection protein [Bacteroidota bacterium]|nr:DNA starvation/stationary phase protection protein [Bacteroidota bacterium]